MKHPLAPFAGHILSGFTRLMTDPRVVKGTMNLDTPRIFYANHRSNADTVVIWTALSPAQRQKLRPVAAADYWHTTPMRRFVGEQIFNILPVERNAEKRQDDPIATMKNALDGGHSLLIFPEGKRNQTDEELLDFKTGIYHLAKQRPETEFVPIWINNIDSILPKGEYVPLPVLCTLNVGEAFQLDSQDKASALDLARKNLLELK